MLEACPEAATEPDTKGDLAIHSVLRLKFDPPVILSILMSYPEVATVRSGDRNLPLHLALANSTTDEVLGTLLDLYPDATMEEDKDGVLPLERAIQRKCPPEMIKRPFLANPYAATFIRNPMGCSPSVLDLITPFLSTPWLFGSPLEVDTQRMAGFLDRCPKAFGIEREQLTECQNYLEHAQRIQNLAESGVS